jgi:UDP-GlcNAc:undecaprenyl-phosphate GlcNAc-1-phosphate transferase
MAINLAACVTAFLIAFITLPVIIKFFLDKNLVDVPGRRKIHKKVTPSLGGIAIFLGFFFSILVWLEIPAWKDIKFLLIPFIIIFFMGVRDDLVPMRASIKLVVQILASALLVVIFDLRLTSFYSLLEFQFPLWLSYLVTIFTIIVVINSFNLIDGLDGLAGTISLLSLMSFGIWFYLVEEPVFALFSFSMAGALVAFLIFNWDPSDIFMGDTGATVIGLLLAIQTIKFINVDHELQNESDFKFLGVVASAACFIIVPLIDTARVFTLRIAKGQSPFTPDKSHIHHAIMRLGMTHAQTTMILGSVQLMFIILAVLLRGFSGFLVLGIVIFLAVGLSFLLDRLIIRKRDSR